MIGRKLFPSFQSFRSQSKHIFGVAPSSLLHNSNIFTRNNLIYNSIYRYCSSESTGNDIKSDKSQLQSQQNASPISSPTATSTSSTTTTNDSPETPISNAASKPIPTKPVKKSDRKMSTLELLHLKREGRKIAMITAYDYPSGLHAENAEFEIVLVGDSLGQ